MNDHLQKCFNEALAKNQAFEWRDRTIRTLDRKLVALAPHDKIQLLRKIDELLA